MIQNISESSTASCPREQPEPHSLGECCDRENQPPIGQSCKKCIGYVSVSLRDVRTTRYLNLAWTFQRDAAWPIAQVLIVCEQAMERSAWIPINRVRFLKKEVMRRSPMPSRKCRYRIG